VVPSSRTLRVVSLVRGYEIRNHFLAKLPAKVWRSRYGSRGAVRAGRSSELRRFYDGIENYCCLCVSILFSRYCELCCCCHLLFAVNFNFIFKVVLATNCRRWAQNGGPRLFRVVRISSRVPRDSISCQRHTAYHQVRSRNPMIEKD
jgi:hypothetical protein